jgi:hypothetical protein
MIAYYCKRCRTAVVASRQANGREKMARFRNGYVARYLACGHTVSVNNAPAAAPIAATVDRPPLSPAEIEETYRAILSRTPDDPAKARRGLEAYLAGYNHTMPASA